MSRRSYYHIAALPILADLGSVPPWTLANLLEHVSDLGPARQVVATLLLGDDLAQREALLSGEVTEVSPAVLSPEQLADQQPLPQWLGERIEESSSRQAGDAVWAAYFAQALDVARKTGSEFLAAWVGHEVALRNALAEARARALGLDPANYLVAAELGRTEADFGPLLAEWTAAADPLAAQQVLDRARWTWLSDHDRWFSFTEDELAVYAARLMLLQRWHRVAAAVSAASGGQAR